MGDRETPQSNEQCPGMKGNKRTVAPAHRLW